MSFKTSEDISKARPAGARKKGLKDRIKGRDSSAPFSPASNGYYKSFDGTKLFYSIEGSGPPLIFCYGLVCSSLHWTYQIEYFRQKYQATWFDYRGHQNSEVPKDLNSLTLESMARDMEILMEELQIQDAVFLGHSMGVNVVLEYYRLFPHRVKGMILSNGTARRPFETLFGNNASEIIFKMMGALYEKSPKLLKAIWSLQKNNPLVTKLVTMGGFNPYLTPQEDVQLYVERVGEMDPAVFVRLIKNYGTYDATSWIHKIEVPTLIIGGQKDKIVPMAEQELMHQLIPGSQLDIVKHGSHCPQMDLPDQINERVDQFLKEIGYVQSARTTGRQ